MATSLEFGGWREQLNKHPLCKVLKENNAKDSAVKNAVDSKNIFCIHGSDMYVWDSLDKRVLHCNLKTLRAQQNNGDVNIISYKTEKSQESLQYQKLLLSDIFSIEIEGICVNNSGNYIAIWGHHGIRVVELPGRWGKNVMFEGGKETVACRTIKIGERNFIGHKNLHIQQVLWHPGSKTDSHLALLTSDNMFSIYNIHEPDEPSSITNINTGELTPTYSPSKSFVGPALGETAVSFDFGRPLVVPPKQKKLSLPPIEVWPVYCVRGNGDILLLYSHLSDVRSIKFPVQGPLTMSPPAEDNYGVDACSIICLPTALPVIIISTCEGRVHHCFQLPPSVAVDEAGQFDSYNTTTSLYNTPEEPSLYVMETAELDLCLSVSRSDIDTSIDDEFMCPVHLKKDPSSPDRYFCAHAAGVHCVALPWLGAVQNYFIEDGDFGMPEEKECIIEHLVCTKPLYSCPTSPVLGVDIVNDPLLGTTLLVLTNDYEFTALPMGLQYQLCPTTTDPSDPGSSVHQSQGSEPFSWKVKQILQKRDLNPILKSCSTTEQSQKNCYQLLIHATKVLRQEYIPRLDSARQEINNRIDILCEHKQYHLDDLKALARTRQELTDHASEIAEKLEATKENHERLFKRLETILRRLQSNVPVLSEAERQMMKELKRIKENMEMYEQSAKQVKCKLEMQSKQSGLSSKISSPFLHQGRLGQIHGVLKEEGNEIEELKKELSRLDLALS